MSQELELIDQLSRRYLECRRVNLQEWSGEIRRDTLAALDEINRLRGLVALPPIAPEEIEAYPGQLTED